MGKTRETLFAMIASIAFASIFVASAYSLCYEPKTAPNFNVTAALGGWHQTYTNELSYLWLESNTYCVQAHYGLNANGTVSVNNTALVGSETSKEIYQILGWATAPNKEKPAQLVVTLQGVPLPAPLWWLATSTINPATGKYEWMVGSDWACATLFIVTKQAVLDASTADSINHAIAKHGWHLNKLVKIGWANCPPWAQP